MNKTVNRLRSHALAFLLLAAASGARPATTQEATTPTLGPEHPTVAYVGGQEGYEASFLVLAANPLEDLEALKGVTIGFKQGVRIFPEASATRPAR